MISSCHPLPSTTTPNHHPEEMCIAGPSASDQSQAGPRVVTVSALSVLSESVELFPWNWSAWLDLTELCIEVTW